MTEEIFKTIVEFPNYMVSNFGNVKGIYGNILKSWSNDSGYNKITLINNGNKFNRFIHRLVANVFIENPNNYNEINHIDGNKSNNHTSNLEWCTHKQNMVHARDILQIYKNDTFSYLKNKPIGRKLTIEEVIKIKEIFKQRTVDEDLIKKIVLDYNVSPEIFKKDTVTEELINSIALEYNVNPQTIKCIYWGKTWKDVE